MSPRIPANAIPLRVPRQSRYGSTLVELLVVIGIIAVLISILMPALSTAREQANRIKCASNMHQIGINLLLYVNSYNGWTPPAEAYTNSHNHGGNLCFLDGHVEYRQYKALRSGDYGLTPDEPWSMTNATTPDSGASNYTLAF
jgi:prepilin-type processing-associated H-X9-DG protein